MINDESDVCAQHGEEIDIADSHHQPQVAAEEDDDGGVFPHAYSPPRKRQTTHFLNIHVRAKPNVIPPPAAAMTSQSSSTGAASSSAGDAKQEGGSVFGRFLAKVRTKAAEAAESGGTGAGAAALLGSIVADKASVLYEITSLVQSVEQEEETAAGDDVGEEEGDGGAGLSHHPRGFGGGSTSPRSRPVLCRVVRSLAHLEAFREDCLKRHPFSMTLTLPKASEGHRPEGVQRVVSFLVMWTASDALRNDPNFLSLMTTPDEEYTLQEMTAEEEQQQQQQKHHDPNSDPASADGGATDSAAASSGPTAAAATLSKGLKQMMSKAKTLLPQKYPIKDLKPPEISDMLMETGVLDRALVSLDKMACCTRASYAFEELQTQEAARCAAWQDAAAKAQQLATAAALEAESMREVGDMLQELCYPLYWPWSRDEVIATLVGEDVPTTAATTTLEASPNARTPSSTKADASGRTPNAESLPASSQSLTPYSPSSPKLASSGAAAAAGNTPVAERARRPPPSQRLTHYLCRVSNIIRKLQSDAECVLSQDVLRSVQQLSLAMEGRLTAAKIAHHRVHVTHPPRTSSVAVSSAEPAIAATLSSSSPAAMVHTARKCRANLCDLQDLLLVIVRAGQGYYETDLLELLDDGTSELQDAYELAMHTFQGEWEQTRGAAVYRVLSAIVENCVAQRLASASNLMLVADVKTTLELDPFLELEELPFTNAAVVHNPSAQQKKLFEEKIKLWAELMAEQEGDAETEETQREGGGGGGTSVLSGGADAVRRMLLEKNNKAGGKGGKWRSALAANTYDDEEDILPCDENEGAGYGSASAAVHAETTRKRRAPPPEPANPFDDATEMSAFDPSSSSPNNANSGSARRFTRSDEGTDTVLPDHIKEVLRRQDSRRMGDSTNLASSSSGNPAAAATTGGGGGADLLDGVPVEELRKRDISSAEFAFDGEQNATKKGKHGNKKSGQKTSSSSSGWGAAVEDHNEDPFKW